MSKIYILSHAPCMDGTGARFSAWKRFGNKAEYFYVNYGNPVPEMEPNSEVYILDFSYPREVLEGLQKTHKLVQVIDHHATAKTALEGVKNCVFDISKSGAVLSWEYFNPGTPVPKLLAHVQDRDLWKFEIPYTKEVIKGLALLEGDMTKWNDVYLTEIGSNLPGNPWTLERLREAGSVLEISDSIKIKSALKSKVKIIKFQGFEIGICNTGELASEICNAICESKELNVDFAAAYCITPKDEVLFSLRSVGVMDVSRIAEKWGGGGHKNASGFRTDLKTLIKILSGELSEM